MLNLVVNKALIATKMFV